MTPIEHAGIDVATLDKATGDVFYLLGILYSAGGEIPADYVSAHKWFNIAVARGNKDAMRLRREIAEEMSGDQIATAQRAARDWLKATPAPVVEAKAETPAAAEVRPDVDHKQAA
jgi:TPR repeat protein